MYIHLNYVEIFDNQKGGCEIVLNMVPRPWFSLNFRHEKVDNKIYSVGCIMFGIANKNYMKKDLTQNSYLGQQSLS